MPKEAISCAHCARLLAHIVGDIGSRRILELRPGTHYRLGRNPLGEGQGLLRCPACKIDRTTEPYILTRAGR